MFYNLERCMQKGEKNKESIIKEDVGEIMHELVVET